MLQARVEFRVFEVVAGRERENKSEHKFRCIARPISTQNYLELDLQRASERARAPSNSDHTASPVKLR